MILLHLGRVVEGAYGSYRLADMLFDLGGQMDIVPVGGEHGQVGAEKAKLIGSGGGVDQVHQVLQGVGDLTALRQIVAALEELRAAHPQLNGEAGAYRVPDGLEHLPGEAQPVLEGASVPVGAVVEGGRQKLVHQPAVAGVDHDHLEARPLAQGGGFAVGLYNVGDLLLGQRLDGDAVGPDPVAGAELGQPLLLVLVHQIGAGVLAGVAQLHAGHRPVAGHGVGQKGPAGQIAGGLQVQVEHVGGICLRVDHQLTGGDGGGAPLGPQLVEAGGPGADTAVGGDVGAPHGGGKHAVAEIYPAYGDGGTEVGVFLFHGKTPLLCLVVRPYSPSRSRWKASRNMVKKSSVLGGR